MYIDPFWAGVVATIMTEITALFVISVIATFKRGKRYGN